jgi:hypothetical protein
MKTEGQYPGFDLEEPDWTDLHGKMEQANLLLLEVRSCF